MEEIWKDISGFEGLYQVSNFGKIRTLKRNKEMKGGLTGFGYLEVCLRKNGKPKHLFIHKTVAQTFIPNPENKPQVNHIDGNKLNNNLNNLEWVTYSENHKHAYRTGLRKSLKGKNNYYSKELMTPIEQYDLEGNFIKRWNSQSEISKTLNIPQQNISLCVRGLRNKAHNYIWKYAKK